MSSASTIHRRHNLFVRSRTATYNGYGEGHARTWQRWLDTNYGREWSPAEKPLAVLHFAFAYELLKDGAIPGLSFGHSPAEYAGVAKTLLWSHFGEGISYDYEALIVSYDWIQPTLSPVSYTHLTLPTNREV